MNYSPPRSFVNRILRARIRECVAIPFSRGSSRPRNQTLVSCIAGRFFTIWATREALVGNWGPRNHRSGQSPYLFSGAGAGDLRFWTQSTSVMAQKFPRKSWLLITAQHVNSFHRKSQDFHTGRNFILHEKIILTTPVPFLVFLHLACCLFFKLYFLFISYFWLHWVLGAAPRPSLVAVSGGSSSLWCVGLSLRWLLIVEHRLEELGLSSYSSQA